MTARASKRLPDPHAAAESAAPKAQGSQGAPYDGFGLLPIAGEWRRGKAGRKLVDRNPYSGEILLEISQDNRDDLDAAHAGAAEAQRTWPASPPAARAQVLARAAEVMDARRAEIVDWLIRESGSMRLKPNLEWQVAHAVMLCAVSVPHVLDRMQVRDGARQRPAGYRSADLPVRWREEFRHRPVQRPMGDRGVQYGPGADRAACAAAVPVRRARGAGSVVLTRHQP